MRGRDGGRITPNIALIPPCYGLLIRSQRKSFMKSCACANQVREQKNVCLTAIGVDAVAIAIRAVCHARMYLEVCHSPLWKMPPV